MTMAPLDRPAPRHRWCQGIGRANPPGAPRTQAIIDSVPVRRVGTPKDVAHAAGLFLDDQAGT